MLRKKIISLIFILTTIVIIGSGCSQTPKKETLNVLNYDIYMDTSLISEFEKANNVTIKYDTYATPEEMYIKAKAGASNYDVIITGEYMIERMINEGMVNKLNFENIPNSKYVDEQFKSQPYDPNNEYAVPYFWGTIGILYNKNNVDISSNSWDILWNEKYSNRIIMMDSQRDAFATALKYLGYSLNSIDENELDEAKDILSKQKPLVMTYMTDGAPDVMINEEADIALVWSGEAVSAMSENENLDFIIPKEGSNIWIDAMVVPTTCRNQDLAEKFINFLSSKEATLKNINEVGYSTVHTEAIKEVDEDLLNNKAFNIENDKIDQMEMFRDPKEFIDLYTSRWTSLMAEKK